jgi:hypothetical protein
VSPSLAAANAASSVSYFVLHICATYIFDRELVLFPLSIHSYPSGASCVNVSAFVTSVTAGDASIAASAVASTTISPFNVPLVNVNENPSFGSLPLADISTSPLIAESHFTVTLTLG